MLENGHLSDEEIMSFVSMTADSLTGDNLSSYFGMIAHFTQCERCRKMKDDMLSFSEKFDDFLSEASGQCGLKMKIYRSMNRLDKMDEIENDVLMSVRATVSKKTGKSVIEKSSPEYRYIEKLPSNTDCEEKYAGVEDIYDNRIVVSEEMVSVSLTDDGKDRHSVLLIPENSENMPVFCRLERKNERWKTECACNDDDYDIVVF